MAVKKKAKLSSPRSLRKITLSKDGTASECSKASTILVHMRDSCQAHLTAYRNARNFRSLVKSLEAEEERLKKTGAKTTTDVEFSRVRGMSTDEEQDLFRAMLVTAASGLDAVTKQLIFDALPVLLEKDEKAQEGLATFVERRLKGELESPEEPGRGTFLARVLTAPSIQRRLIDDYVKSLTGGSLQSAEELARAAVALGIEKPRDAHIDPKALKPIFNCRNKIIHELDINLEAPRRNRNIRTEGEMLSYTNLLLEVAQGLVSVVNEKVSHSK